MQVGMIGLGRMGASMVRRLARAGHDCVVYDVRLGAVQELADAGSIPAESVDDLVGKLTPPRVVWLMVPAALTGPVVDAVGEMMSPGDILVDGGNSNYRDAIVRSQALVKVGLQFVDVGTSGGVFGLERGFCLMVGGEDRVVRHLEPLFQALAPGMKAEPRTPGRSGEPTTAERGYLHCGPAGAGHFVKMVHNGIEYGLMAALAEGLALLGKANVGFERRDEDAETAPFEHPEWYQYHIDVAAVTELWRRGSVVASWLLDLTATTLVRNPTLDGVAGEVLDSGAGRWAAMAAIDMGVPVPVLTAALCARFASQRDTNLGNKVVSAMRKELGGHEEKAQAEVSLV